MVVKILEANHRLEEIATKDIIVGSIDVEPLYPCIDHKIRARIVAKKIIENSSFGKNKTQK